MTKFTSRALRAALPLAGLLAAAPAWAALQASTGLKDTATKANLIGAGTTAKPALIVGQVFQGLLGALGAVIIVRIVYAGFLYFTDQGAGDKAKVARVILRNSVIGLVVIFASYTLVGYVVTTLVEIDRADPNPAPTLSKPTDTFKDQWDPTDFVFPGTADDPLKGL